MQRDGYHYVAQLAEHACGVALGDDKRYLLDARLAPLCRELALSGVQALADLLQQKPDEELRRRTVEALTTNETFWFRDPGLFEALTDQLVPEFFARAGDAAPFRIWSAAASTGQEPYSLAMAWQGAGLPRDRLIVLATEFDREALARAKSARYTQLEVGRGLAARLLIEHFEQQGSEWLLRPAIREMVVWREHNLLQPPAESGGFDLILCRNVLIYFAPKTRQRVLNHLIAALAPGGWLVLSGSESLIGLEHALEQRVIGKLTLHRKPHAAA